MAVARLNPSPQLCSIVSVRWLLLIPTPHPSCQLNPDNLGSLQLLTEFGHLYIQLRFSALVITHTPPWAQVVYPLGAQSLARTGAPHMYQLAPLAVVRGM